jgi:5-methylcytosine-specific restriction endonuclease McrA
MPELIRRKHAKAARLLHYFTGKPCKHGHVTDRETVNGGCRECGRIRAANRGRFLWSTQHDLMLEKARARNVSEEQKEKNRASARAYAKANPDLVKAYHKQRYLEKSEEVKARSNAYHHANIEAASVRSKAWRDANRDKVVANQKKSKWARKARMKGAVYEDFTLDDVIRRDGLDCYICDIRTDPDAPVRTMNRAELEHVVSLANGGSHTRDNLRCACFRCNRIKGWRLTPEETRAIVDLRATRAAKGLVLIGV